MGPPYSSILTVNVSVLTSQISSHLPVHDLTASFFESVDNRTAPTQSTFLKGPATSFPVFKLQIRAVTSHDLLTSSVLSSAMSTQVIGLEWSSNVVVIPVSTLHALSSTRPDSPPPVTTYRPVAAAVFRPLACHGAPLFTAIAKVSSCIQWLHRSFPFHGPSGVLEPIVVCARNVGCSNKM